jgi:hypothetical protein
MLADYAIDEMLSKYFEECHPQVYGPLEAKQFRSWFIATMDEETACSLLDYDLAVLEANLYDKTVSVSFKRDPRVLFEALSNHEFPICDAEPLQWEIEIVPD